MLNKPHITFRDILSTTYNFICFQIYGFIYTTTSTITKLFQNLIPTHSKTTKAHHFLTNEQLQYMQQQEKELTFPLFLYSGDTTTLKKPVN